MAKRKGKAENLKPFNTMTVEEQREIQSAGGKKSVEVRKEKKLMSQILADYLQKEHEVVLRDDEGAVIDREKISADELIQRTITAIINRGDPASVSMMKELREATEGKNVNISATIETADITAGMTIEQKKELIAEWLKKNQ